MKRIFVFCALILAITACNKDKVESKPHLKFKSFNGNLVPVGSTLRVTVEFTDQEGDLETVFVLRERLNQRGAGNFLPIDLAVPEFGNQNHGELELRLDYATQLTFNLPQLRIPGSNPERYEPDTMNLRFYVKDKAGNQSDTTPPERLIVFRQQ